MSGKVIEKINSQKAYLEIEFDDAASGVYFVNIKSKNKASTYKIVKE
ncbi:T9SS type A sorting domain-containing protein [Winogradskyella sp.]